MRNREENGKEQRGHGAVDLGGHHRLSVYCTELSLSGTEKMSSTDRV